MPTTGEFNGVPYVAMGNDEDFSMWDTCPECGYVSHAEKVSE